MSTSLMEKCPVCTAPLSSSQKLSQSRSNTVRSTSRKPNTLGYSYNAPIVTQSRLLNTSNPALEAEYIKQLQEQIYYLETECLYLRDQLNKNSILLDRSLNDDRLHQAEQERSNLERSLAHTATHYDQVASEKHGLTVALDDLRQKFDIEKQNLLDELDMLKRAKDSFEQDKSLRDQELRKIREQTRTSSDELKAAQAKIRALETQLGDQLDRNRDLNDNIRQMKLETSNLQRSLNNYELTNREKDRLQDTVNELERELDNARKELKAQETRYTDAQYLRGKLTDEKSALMKETSRLENLTKELERELDQVRHQLRDRIDALQLKDKELTALRKKEQNFRTTVEDLQRQIEAESKRNKELDGQIKQLQRQLSSEGQNTVLAKRDANEQQLRNARLQSEIDNLQRDKDHLTSHLSTLQRQLAAEQDLTAGLRAEIQDLEDRVKEIDRLKALEDLIQSQRWDDVTQIAKTMQTIGQTMARATSPSTTRKRIELK